MRIICPHCEKRYIVSDDFHGKSIRCRNCQRTIGLPDDAPSAAASPAGDAVFAKKVTAKREKLGLRSKDDKGKNRAVLWMVAGGVGMVLVGGGLLGLVGYLLLKPGKPSPTELAVSSEPGKTSAPGLEKPNSPGNGMPPTSSVNNRRLTDPPKAVPVNPTPAELPRADHPGKQSPADLIKKLQHSVVLIEVTDSDGTRIGNGFFGDDRDGTIAKNRKPANVVFTSTQVFGPRPKFGVKPKQVHAVLNPGSATEKRLEALLSGYDRRSGLALVDVQVPTGTSLPPPLPVAENPAQAGSTLHELGYAVAPGGGHRFAPSELKIGAMRPVDGEVPAISFLGSLPMAYPGGPIVDQAGNVVALAIASSGAAQPHDGLPAPSILKVIRGKVERIDLEYPMRKDKQVTLAVAFELIDPARQLDEIWAEWWLENLPANDDGPRILPVIAAAAAGGRQKAALKRDGEFARGAIEMSEPPPGQVIWLEAHGRSAAGHEVSGPLKVEFLERAANPEKVPLLCKHRIGNVKTQIHFRGDLQVGQQKIIRKVDASLIEATTEVDVRTQQRAGLITFSKYHALTVIDNQPDPQMPRATRDINHVEKLSIRIAADHMDFYTMFFTDPASPSKDEGILVQAVLGIGQVTVLPMQMGVVDVWYNNHKFMQAFPNQVGGEPINMRQRYRGTDVRNGRKVAIVQIDGHFHGKSVEDFDPLESLHGVAEIDLAAMRVSYFRTLYRITPTLEGGGKRALGRGWMEIEISRDFTGQR